MCVFGRPWFTREIGVMFDSVIWGNLGNLWKSAGPLERPRRGLRGAFSPVFVVFATPSKCNPLAFYSVFVVPARKTLNSMFSQRMRTGKPSKQNTRFWGMQSEGFLPKKSAENLFVRVQIAPPLSSKSTIYLGFFVFFAFLISRVV